MFRIKALLAGSFSCLVLLAISVFSPSLMAQVKMTQQKEESYIPKYDNIAYAMIKVEECTFPRPGQLDTLIDESRKIFNKHYNWERRPEKKREIAMDLLEQTNSLIINTLPELDKQKDYCYRISLLSLAIAREYKLPLYGALTTDHVYHAKGG